MSPAMVLLFSAWRTSTTLSATARAKHGHARPSPASAAGPDDASAPLRPRRPRRRRAADREPDRRGLVRAPRAELRHRSDPRRLAPRLGDGVPVALRRERRGALLRLR